MASAVDRDIAASEDHVEFLDYTSTVQELKSLGICERRDGALARFELASGVKPVVEAFRLVIGPEGSGAGDDGADFIPCDVEKLPDVVEGIIHRSHLSEVVLIPVGTWGKILDVAVFDLATDESWLEVDAEASLHQKGRDPLAVEARDMHVVKSITASLLKHADCAEQDLTIAATGSSLVIEFSRPGVVRVWCAGPAMADKIAKMI